jgi:hypothetical protein
MILIDRILLQCGPQEESAFSSEMQVIASAGRNDGLSKLIVLLNERETPFTAMNGDTYRLIGTEPGESL